MSLLKNLIGQFRQKKMLFIPSMQDTVYYIRYIIHYIQYKLNQNQRFLVLTQPGYFIESVLYVKNQKLQGVQLENKKERQCSEMQRQS